MAATLQARRLTEAHRVAQARLGADVVRQMLLVWPLLDPSDLDASIPRWLAAVQPLVGANRTTSARLAANYLTTFRAIELGVATSTFAPVLAESAKAGAVETSVLVTGPYSLRRNLAKGMPFARAMNIAQSGSASAALRYVLDGGRETVVDTTREDSRALGWCRVASASACAFCAMAASQGPRFNTEDAARFEAHVKCTCSAEPVYRELTRDQWPAQSARYRELYDETAKGTDDPLNSFRQALAAG